MASILAISGSARRGSWNSRLLNIAADAVEVAGGKVTRLEMRDYPLPLYDEDLEKDEGLPPLVRQLRSLFVEHQGLLIASPEYNSSITPLLKNVIDWVSRPVVGEPPLAAFRGKVAALFSASPGALGGLRGLVHVRSILGNIGVLVLPDQLAIPRAHQAFHADEPRFIDDGQDGAIRRIAAELVRVIDRLNG
ncbi:MAG TPA: NAD(P)H-dependent oxidoreductase [Pirellulaceae bacterium]|nr:NAD(P)H-dependent oxidoreductase [Pirellulaceae bacterium]